MANNKEKQMIDLFKDIKSKGSWMYKIEGFKIKTYGLSSNKQVYREISGLSQELLPIITPSQPKIIRLDEVRCNDKAFLNLYGDIVSEWGLLSLAGELKLTPDPNFLSLVPAEVVNLETRRVTTIGLRTMDTVNLIPDACLALVNAALKRQLPKISKQSDYYTAGSIGYLAKHIAASKIDEQLGIPSISHMVTTGMVANLYDSMSKLNLQRGVPKNIREDAKTQSYFGYYAHEVGSELTGLVAYERYQQDPEKVGFFFRQLVDKGFYKAEDFLTDIGASYNNIDTKSVLTKAFNSIK